MSALLALVLNLPARCPRNALSWLTSPHLARAPAPFSLLPLLAFTDDSSSQRPPPSPSPPPRSAGTGRVRERGERTRKGIPPKTTTVTGEREEERKRMISTSTRRRVTGWSIGFSPLNCRYFLSESQLHLKIESSQGVTPVPRREEGEGEKELT